MTRKTVGKDQRQFGERADIQIDHAELLVPRQRGRRADQSKAGVIDDKLRLKFEQEKLLANLDRGVTLFEVCGQHHRTRLASRCDLVGQSLKAVLTPRDKHKFVTMCREHPRQLRADAGGSAGDQRDGLHASSPESTRR